MRCGGLTGRTELKRAVWKLLAIERRNVVVRSWCRAWNSDVELWKEVFVFTLAPGKAYSLLPCRRCTESRLRTFANFCLCRSEDFQEAQLIDLHRRGSLILSCLLLHEDANPVKWKRQALLESRKAPLESYRACGTSCLLTSAEILLYKEERFSQTR